MIFISFSSNEIAYFEAFKIFIMSIEEVILRPRFQKKIPFSGEYILNRLAASKDKQTDFIVSRVDQHVFIRIPKHKQHFWSPQLHLRIEDVDENSCIIHGLFGPSPTVWTFFMFLHFLVACLFIGFGIWAYSNAVLNNSYAIQVALMFLMVIIWFSLYFGGRWGKSTGKPEMIDLHNFMNSTIDS